MGKLSDTINREIVKALREAEVQRPLPEQDTDILADAITEALKPILKDIIDDIDTINKALPTAFKAIGAGSASAGAAGSSSYQSKAGTKVKASVSRTKRNIKDL